jgi:hypothetical protein
MSIDAALRRADQFITEQMHKFEQQRKGRPSPPRAYSGYGHILDPSSGTPLSHPPPSYQISAPAPSTPSQGPLPQQGWRQEFDCQTQRWYYINLSTGRSQWDPPSFGQPSRAQTYNDERSSRDDRQRSRASSQPQRPSSGGQYLGVNRDARRQNASASPHPSTHGRLPPGAHLDMSTGQVVTSMFPPGQTAAQWAREVGRV